jgi:uncharacterized protein YndB with AHSA1/START domain
VAQAKASKASIAANAPVAALEIVRIFDAPRPLVFAMWAEPRHLDQWSAPKGLTLSDARSDFREGGSYYVHMRSPEGEIHRLQGVYKEIVDGRRIVMTHVWLDEDGTPNTESLITVTFADEGKKTKMTFVQEGFPSEASRRGHAEGWTECFDFLEAYLAQLASS